MIIRDVTKEYLKNAMPEEGTMLFDNGYNIADHKEEIKIGTWLHDALGGDVMFLQETSAYKIKTPDYIWREKAWELKTIFSAKAADSALRTGAKQVQANTGGIIFKLESDIDIPHLENVLARRFKRVSLKELDILIVSGNVLQKALRYKK